MKTIIIADLHGYSMSFRNILRKTEPVPQEDRLILLGDLFDRGPDSWEIMKMVQSLKDEYLDRFSLLKGNHEDYLLSEKLTLKQKLEWRRVGRESTVASFRAHSEKMEDAVPWLKANCQLYYKETYFQCVHAGLKVDPIEINDHYTLLHDHTTVFDNHFRGKLTIIGHLSLQKPTWFAGDGETIELLSYGEEKLLPKQGVICIDTGCGKGGKLSAMIITGDTYRLECVPQK